MVLEALAAAEVETVFLLDGDESLIPVAEAAEAAGVPPIPVTEGVMRSLTDTSTPQGAVAVVTRSESDLRSLPASLDLALVLVSVRDPGNAGTLIRSSVAAGAGAVIFTGQSVDPFGPKTVRSSAGMLFRTSIVISQSVDEVTDALRSRGVRLVGAEAGAPLSHHDADLTKPVAFAVGNEAWGLPQEVRALLDETVAIDMPGPAESLNVGIAGSLLLFEAVRQRRARAL